MMRANFVILTQLTGSFPSVYNDMCEEQIYIVRNAVLSHKYISDEFISIPNFILAWTIIHSFIFNHRITKE